MRPTWTINREYFIHWTLKGNGPGLSYLYDDLEHLKYEFFSIIVADFLS